MMAFFLKYLKLIEMTLASIFFILLDKLVFEYFTDVWKNIFRMT